MTSKSKVGEKICEHDICLEKGGWKSATDGKDYCRYHWWGVHKMNNMEIDTETKNYFDTLHCVNFADMTQETREFLFAKCINLFRSNIVMANTQNEVA